MTSLLLISIVLTSSFTVEAQEQSMKLPRVFTAKQAEAGRNEVLKNEFGNAVTVIQLR